MRYEIVIEYITGDSFGNCDEIGCVGHEWESLWMAKESLKRIASHYEFYLKIDTLYPNEKPEELPLGVGWDDEYRVITLLLMDDNGNEFRSDAFWCGYFEKLKVAHIQIANDYSKSDEIVYVP